jgi:membrane-associated protein
MLDLILFIKTLGYFGLFSIVFVESGVFFGFFFPGDSLLFTAGFLASQGLMDIWVLIIGVVVAAVLGVSAGYAFGKTVGPMIFSREDSLFFHKDNLIHTKHFYEKYGKKAIILARFMPGIRTFAPIFAGIGKMNYGIFLAYNVIGGLIWGAGLPLLGYFLGNSIPNIDKYLIPIVLLIIFLSVLPTVIHILKDEENRKNISNGFKKMFARTSGKLLVFNWKMNPETLEEALQMAKDSDYKNSVVVPPFIFIEEVGKILKNAKLGAQDLFSGNLSKTSFTGEISGKELVNLNVQYVIIGHSERRAMGETDETISQKLKTSLDNDLIPILCIGENQQEKEKGTAKEIIKNQIASAMALVKNANKPIILAYEPVWAIGTGNYCPPEKALETIRFIKDFLNLHFSFKHFVLYGGSVNPENIKDFLKYKEIDGALIGGSSLKPEFFFK